MATRANRIILTYDDYAKLPDDGKRYELYEGEIHQMPPAPSTAHQRAVIGLSFFLFGHVRDHRLGTVLVAPYDVVLSDVTVLQPDIVFVSLERQQVVLAQHARGAPDLVVEVISPSTSARDRGIKQQLYARYGVVNYWQVDPRQRQAVAYVLDEGVYHPAVTARGDDTFTAPPFPELLIPLAELWT